MHVFEAIFSVRYPHNTLAASHPSGPFHLAITMRLLILAALMFTLSGCASKPMTNYVAPPGKAYATIRNDLSPTVFPSPSVLILVNRGAACKQGQPPSTQLEFLFGIGEKSTPKTDAEVETKRISRVVAGEPLRIHYQENVTRRTRCEFEVEFTPQANKEYALSGGAVVNDKETRKCGIMIINTTDKTIEKLLKVDQTGFCNDD